MRERIRDVEGQDLAALVAVTARPPMGRGFFGLQGLWSWMRERIHDVEGQDFAALVAAGGSEKRPATGRVGVRE